jgi:hypothetical protein
VEIVFDNSDNRFPVSILFPKLVLSENQDGMFSFVW